MLESFERLSGVAATDRERQTELAHQMARDQSIVIVLKGNASIVTNGHEYYRNTTGNPKMATGGSGDCLTGMITALICQRMPPLEASILAVYLHGLAGDLAAQAIGSPSILATDIIAHLPQAFAQVCFNAPH